MCCCLVLWMFGGYTCTENGLSNGGGIACFPNSLYTLDINTSSINYLTWSQFTSNANDHYWPEGRAWHSVNSWQERYIVVFGGSSIDQSSSQYYYNDVYLFDTQNMIWKSIPTRGKAPPVSKHMFVFTLYYMLYLFMLHL